MDAFTDVSPKVNTGFNPSVTARLKISQDVDRLAKVPVPVYLVHLKVEQC